MKKINGKKLLNRKKLLCGVLFAFVALSVVLTVGGAAFAAGGGGEQALPWEAGLQTLQTSITGPVATVISLVAVVGAGAALIFGGNIQGFMRTSVYIVLVVGIVLGVNSLLTSLGYTVSANVPLSEFLR
ncbi:MAG: TrbC/VirB2 family protein [Synergistaceae bacterium]|nr:TrbC/VirB2 family protein [Synergistaceae bacterium]